MTSSTFNTRADFGHDPLSKCVEIIDDYKRPLVPFFKNILQRLTSRICRSRLFIFEAANYVVR